MTPDERNAIAARANAATTDATPLPHTPGGGFSGNAIADGNGRVLGWPAAQNGAAPALAALWAHAAEDILALLADVDRAEHDMRNAVFLYQQMRNALRAYFGGSAQASARAELLLRDLAAMGRE